MVSFLNVAGARPNFMKIAPLQWEMEDRDHVYTTVHTGQHYDREMSDEIFDDLNLTKPDYNLEVGSGTDAEQTARALKRLEPVISTENPDIVNVVGDVNSTLSGALAASKLEPKVAHIEGGIRSGDRSMPEELNRILTDQIANYIFCFDRSACENLRNEGIPEERIFLVGDVMIDSLLNMIDREPPDLINKLPERHAVLTLHRPINVDRRSDLERAFDVLKTINEHLPIVFPVHPRTRENLVTFEVFDKWDREFFLLDPLRYRAFVHLMNHSTLVVTDSGSIQQETTVLNIPCFTMRQTTERLITVEKGTNELLWWDQEERIMECLQQVLDGQWKEGENIKFWDGKTAGRIMDVFEMELDTE